MISIFPSEKHYFFEISNEVAEICEPLKKYGVNYFTCVRCFDDGTIYFLSNNREAHINHFKKQYLIAPPISINNLGNKFNFLAVVENNNNIWFDQAYHDYGNLFNISYPLFMFERHVGYVNFFIFGTSCNNSKIVNFYLNEISVLENFCVLFKEKANKLLGKANDNKILLPEHMRLTFKGLEPKNSSSNNDIVVSSYNKFKSTMDMLNISLTKREVESMYYLLKGRTACETAKALNISPKTVESYIDSIKYKLNCNNRAELFDKAWELNLVDIIKYM